MAFDRPAADDPAALDLLTLVAWCGPEPVPLTLLTDNPRALPDRLSSIAEDPLAMASCTGILHRRAMATVLRHSLQLHRVPAPLLRARIGNTSTAPRGWPPSSYGCCGPHFRKMCGTTLVWQIGEQLLPHVLAVTVPERDLIGDKSIDVARQAAWLLNRAGVYRQTSGEPHAALPLVRRAYASYRQLVGDDHPDTLGVCRCREPWHGR